MQTVSSGKSPYPQYVDKNCWPFIKSVKIFHCQTLVMEIARTHVIEEVHYREDNLQNFVCHSELVYSIYLHKHILYLSEAHINDWIQINIGV